MPRGETVTAWYPPKGSHWFPMAIYGGAMSLVIWALQLPGWWTLGALAPGWSVVALVGSRLYAAAEYELSAEALTRRSRGRSETLLLGDITSVYGYYGPRTGEFITIQGRERAFSVQMGGEINGLLEVLGSRLVDLGRDRQVIQDEKTRRRLGLPGGGLRDPWTPKD